MNQGFTCENHHFSYMPTYTGPGHAAIYTGTTPAMNGIIANDWWDKYQKKYVYCAEDLSVTPVGSEHKMEKRSPKNLMVTTLGDQVKLGTNYRGKVIGISIKDRGAIFPAGKMGDQAWWFTGEDGRKFIKIHRILRDEGMQTHRSVEPSQPADRGAVDFTDDDVF